MSKFFRALENAEREREAERPAEAPRPEPAAVAVDADAEPRAGAAPAEPAVAPPPAGPPEPPRADDPPRAARVEARRPVEPPRVEAPRAEPAPPAEPAPLAGARTAAPPPEPRVSAYGAPVARDARTGAHETAFTGLLEPAPAEPGDLDDHLVSLLEPTSPAAEQYRALRLHIETLHRERGFRAVAISSPHRGDGKTLSAINLAGALAQAPDARVVLVEVDVRNPGAAGYLGLPPARGLSSYLLDPAMTVDSVLEQPAGIGFAVVVAGAASTMPYELLKSPRLGALLADLRARFDYVVVDTPPVLPFPDVGLLRDLVDGFVLVVRANRTPREMVRDSVATLGQARVIGLVFNDDERTQVERGSDGGWRTRLGRPLGAARAA